MTQTITPDAVRKAGNLITLDDAMNILNTTEPLELLDFRLDGSDRVHFDLPDTWNEGVREMGDSEITECRVTINGVDSPLTKEALLSMTSAIGLQKSYVTRTPGSLIQP